MIKFPLQEVCDFSKCLIKFQEFSTLCNATSWESFLSFIWRFLKHHLRGKITQVSSAALQTLVNSSRMVFNNKFLANLCVRSS